MCGLFGFGSNRSDIDSRLEQLRAARDVLTHRGPDQCGEWYDEIVYMGHRRLSILDLSEAGRQPMTSADKHTVITVNGEIYNYKQLRDELRALGAVFVSDSDSEVVLHGYRLWGLDVLVEKIDGMYAIIIYDRQKNRIFLVRDRVGIKPLYYELAGDGLTWASELKALVNFYGADNLEHDNTALFDFITYRYIPAPKTAYKNIFKLEQASILEYDTVRHTHRLYRYWALPLVENTLSDDVRSHTIRKLLRESIAEQMVADVPVGFFLSGGVDSSILVAEASAISKNLHTYTIGFGHEGFDETPFAEQVAKKFQTYHHVKIIDQKTDMPFPNWMNAMFDEPFGDVSALPTWHVAQFARDGVTVALGGDGGDELFGGYKRYQDIFSLYKKMKFLRYVPLVLLRGRLGKWKNMLRYARIMRKKDNFLALFTEVYFTKISAQSEEKWRRILGIEASYDALWFFKKHWKPEIGLRKAMQYLDFMCYLPDDILVKVDRTTMAHHLEARVPFLSRKLVEFAFSCPESFIYKNNKLKGGIKSVFTGVLPDDILNRGKQGFSVPWKNWRSSQASQSIVDAILLNFMQDKQKK